MSSSPRQLSSRELDQINKEVIDHMKRSGTFDDIRMNLMELIWSSPEFREVIQRFEFECERFCENIDLGETRNALRARLAQRFDGYSHSKNLAIGHISAILKNREEGLKSTYLDHAETFLRRFIPQTPEKETSQLETERGLEQNNHDTRERLEPTQGAQLVPHDNHDTQTDQATHSDNHDRAELEADRESQQEQLAEMDMDIETSSISEDEIERPVYSPIGNEHSSPIDRPSSIKDGHPSPIGNEHPSSIGQENPSPSEIPLPPSPLPDDNSDELEKLTFSSVSSVNTADLSDFDNSIKLSDDDEANIVGKPKNSKVPLEVIRGQIFDLQNTSVKGAESRRATRTRKSNPKYSSEDYKLL